MTTKKPTQSVPILATSVEPKHNHVLHTSDCFPPTTKEPSNLPEVEPETLEDMIQPEVTLSQLIVSRDELKFQLDEALTAEKLLKEAVISRDETIGELETELDDLKKKFENLQKENRITKDEFIMQNQEVLFTRTRLNDSWRMITMLISGQAGKPIQATGELV